MKVPMNAIAAGLLALAGAAGCAADGSRERGRPPPPPVATIPDAGNPLRRDRPMDVLRDTGGERGPAELELGVEPKRQP